MKPSVGRRRRRVASGSAASPSTASPSVARHRAILAVVCLACLAGGAAVATAPTFADSVGPPPTESPSPSPTASSAAPDAAGAGGGHETAWVAGVGGGVAVVAVGAWLGLRKTAGRRPAEAQTADSGPDMPDSAGDEP